MDQGENYINLNADDDTIPAPAPTPATTPDDDGLSGSSIYEKSQHLVDIANNTFRELCKSLESEQTKLLELEERRKKLQEEMQLLKSEIEEEKNFFQVNLRESVSDKLKIINNDSSNDLNEIEERDSSNELEEIEDRDSSNELEEIEERESEITNNQHVDTCYEVDDHLITTARSVSASNSKTVEEHTDDIKAKLQAVLDQCKDEHGSISDDTEIIAKIE